MLTIKKLLWLIGVLFFASHASVLYAQPILKNRVISSGGALFTDGKFQIMGTVGQLTAGASAGQANNQSGFWYQWKTLPYANAFHIFVPEKVIVPRGRQVRIPIRIQPEVTGDEIIAFQFQLGFDPGIMSAVGFATDSSLTGTDWTITLGTQTPGQVMGLAFSTMPLHGSGTLLFLDFAVAASAPAGAGTILKFQQFMFNEGQPMVVTHDGSVIVQESGNLLISGKAAYWLSCAGSQPIPNLLVSLSGDTLAQIRTDARGDFLFLLTRGGNLKLTARKDSDVNGITAFDAARVAQSGAGLIALSECQKLAADVTDNGQVTAFDAARIAQYSANLPHNSLCGTWKMLPDSFQYVGLNRDTTRQDFSAILYGEVTGNWQPTAALAGKGSDSTAIESDVLLAVSEVTKTRAGEILVPIRLQNNEREPIYAVQLTLGYPSDALSFMRASAPDSVSLITHNTENGLNVVLYSILPIPSGDLCQLYFKASESARLSEELNLYHALVNESKPRTQSGTLNLMVIPERYYLDQNVPNPFNPRTNIRFELPAQTKVSLKIYDIGGRLVKTLVSENRAAGYHSVIWDGTDEAGRPVSSGIYFYRFEAGGSYHAVKRMLFIK